MGALDGGQGAEGQAHFTVSLGKALVHLGELDALGSKTLFKPIAPLGIAPLQVYSQAIEPAQRGLDDLGEMPGGMARGLRELQVAKQRLYARVAGADVRLDGGENDLTSHCAAFILIPDHEMRIDSGLQRIFFQQPGAECMDGRDGGVGETGQRLPPIESWSAVGGHVRDTRQHLPLEAVAHFGRRLLGEGDGQELSWRDALLELRQIGAHQRGGLARASAGIDDGIAREGHSRLLPWVKREHRSPSHVPSSANPSSRQDSAPAPLVQYRQSAA